MKQGSIHTISDFFGVIEASEHDDHNFRPLNNTSIMRRRQRTSKIENSFCVGVCRINLIEMDIIRREFSRYFRI